MPEDDSTPNSIKNEPPAKLQVDTGGAAYVRGDVVTGGGDFIGRNRITEETTYNVHGLRNLTWDCAASHSLPAPLSPGAIKNRNLKNLRIRSRITSKWMNRMTP